VVGRAEFDEAFTGVALAFAPGPDFVPKGTRPSLTGILARHVSRYRRGLLLAAVAGTLAAIPAIFLAGLSRVFVDGVLVQQRAGWLTPLLLGMIGIAAVRMLLTYLQHILLLRTQTAMSVALLARQMWAVLHLPLSFFAQRFAGDIAGRFMLVDRLTGLLTGTLMPIAIGLVAIVIYGVALFFLDPILTFVVLTGSLLALLVLSLSVRGIENASRRMVHDEAKLQAITIQGVAMAEDFRASGTEGTFVSRWTAHLAKVVLANLAAAVTALTAVAVLVVGGFQVMDGVITIGVLLAFQLLMGNFTGPLLSLVGVGGQLQQVRGLAERLDDIVAYRTSQSVPATPPGDAHSPQDASLALRRVSFGYAALDAPFIHDFDLEIASGARVGIVGGSGSGKSTVGRLIVGLVQPRSGTVEIGGMPLGAWHTAALRRSLAYVDQSVSLFEETISENITLWDRTLPEQRRIAAAHDAAAHGFITARSGGYAARLTEAGGNLSGGERQRLAIARALAVDPAILVLDEATSALDPDAESTIMDAVRRRGCTCVVIAHRVSTIRDCDLILVMERGRVIESGTHADLMQRGDHYRRLVEN
jgi:ABC-type bacteriocin/lantibiotic exporter with double-glycine peptidase domain